MNNINKILFLKILDFECTKIHQRLFNQVCWFPTSLTVNHQSNVNEPSFLFPHIERQRDHLFGQQCWCAKFLRKLKYCFKNCFNVANYNEEFEISDHIFQRPACGICLKSFKR